MQTYGRSNLLINFLKCEILLEVINRQNDYNISTLQRLQKEMLHKLSSFEIYKLVGNLPKIIELFGNKNVQIQ